MNNDYAVKEVTGKDTSIIKQIACLEDKVLKHMENNGKKGQLFTTGYDDILEYAESDENTVMVAVQNEEGNGYSNEKVIAAAYITQGQTPFTYNDITKYFKAGEDYKEYVREQYKDDNEYKKDLMETYKMKIEAFNHAKRIILGEVNFENIEDYLNKEISENGFHEKSELRDKLNQYMSMYIMENYGDEGIKKYEQFYWTSAEEIFTEFNKESTNLKEPLKDYENFLGIQKNQEYEMILKKGQLQIHEEPEFDEKKYYSANTGNSIELDTYITDPENRSAGLARIIVYEGIKKHMDKFFSDPSNEAIFLCSTLHRDNLSSKYVSEFFGLTDSLFVNRRQGRDREVHICNIPRENFEDYLSNMEKKLAVLYGYNPNRKGNP
ncbi:MAG: hypothetical protein IJV31_09075 [Clostridia bacterium]|nr:hypothetical protein [Clostridia bacterium]